MHELEERIESILMSLELPCSEGDVRDAVQELLELKELVNSKKSKVWSDDDMIVFADWFRGWYGHPEVGHDAYFAFKKWKERKNKKITEIDFDNLLDKYGPEGLMEIAKKLEKTALEHVANAMKYGTNS